MEELLDRLTEEDYQIAEKNGIHRKLAKYRYEQGGMDRLRAVTQPVRELRNDWPKWKEVAEKNGVSMHLFYKRTGKDVGWTPERAATTPKFQPGQYYNTEKVIPEELVKRAAKNGISKGTLYQRLKRYEWDEERAVTEKPGSRRRRGINNDNRY